MAISRKDALKRLNGLAPRVEEHLAKLASDPETPDASHWQKEVGCWLDQMVMMLPHIGRKTAARWAQRISVWKSSLEQL